MTASIAITTLRYARGFGRGPYSWKVTWRGYFLVLGFLSLLASGIWAVQRQLMPPAPFSPDVLDVVQNSERVRIQRMVPMQGTPPAGAAYYENCSLVGSGKAVEPTEDWLDEFRDLLCDGRTYSASTAPGVPYPRVVVRFVKGRVKVDVLVAFDKDIVLVQKNGIASGTGVFLPRRADILRLVGEIFPDDAPSAAP